MRVYRVESPYTLEGPYTGDVDDTTQAMRADHNERSFRAHPTPRTALGHCMGSEQKCAFVDMQSLFRWFGGWLRGILAEGFVISVIVADDYIGPDCVGQVVFTDNREVNSDRKTNMEQGIWYTPDELRELPSLCTGQADEQVGETPTQRVWWGRTEDSPPVSIETFDVIGRRWETTYEGNPRCIRWNYANTIDIEEGF